MELSSIVVWETSEGKVPSSQQPTAAYSFTGTPVPPVQGSQRPGLVTERSMKKSDDASVLCTKSLS